MHGNEWLKSLSPHQSKKDHFGWKCEIFVHLRWLKQIFDKAAQFPVGLLPLSGPATPSSRTHTQRGKKPNHKTINNTTHKWSQIAKPFLSKDHLWDKCSEQDKSWGSRYCIKSWRSGEIQEYTNNSSLLRRWMQWMFLKAAITANNCVAVMPGGLTQVPGEGARHTLEGGSCSGELSHRA